MSAHASTAPQVSGTRSTLGHAPGRGRPARGRRSAAGLAFVSPFIFALTLFMLVPIVFSIYQSLYTTKLIGGTSFTGLANYGKVLSSPQFWGGVGRVALFAVIQVPLTIALAAFFAAVFDAGVVRLGKFFRTLYFVPFAVPAVVASMMWSFLLLPRLGPFSKLAASLGLGNVDFSSSGLLMPTIIAIVIWEWTGYNMIILFTAFRSVPRSVTEAALLDGARFSTLMLKVKLPMVTDAIVMLCFINMIGALQLFTEPQILSSFQPQAVSFGYTPTLYVYNTAIGSAEYNLGAAAAVVLGLLIGAASVMSLGIRRRRGEFR